MNKALELPIYRDSYCLTQEVMTYTSKFSKDYKYMLGNRLNEDCRHCRPNHWNNNPSQLRPHIRTINFTCVYQAFIDL